MIFYLEYFTSCCQSERLTAIFKRGSIKLRRIEAKERNKTDTIDQIACHSLKCVVLTMRARELFYMQDGHENRPDT